MIITRIKFSRRCTTVFRSDGHVDFIGTNNIVYSSRNIDFNKMKWDPTSSQEILHNRRIYSPIIKDVVFDENDLLLITNEGITYIFNLVRMTVSKTQVK